MKVELRRNLSEHTRFNGGISESNAVFTKPQDFLLFWPVSEFYPTALQESTATATVEAEGSTASRLANSYSAANIGIQLHTWTVLYWSVTRVPRQKKGITGTLFRPYGRSLCAQEPFKRSAVPSGI